MSWGLRILLIVGPILTGGWILIKIRKNRLRMENSLFWILFSALLLLLGVFPGIAEGAAGLLGVQSPVNLVYLTIIFLLLVRVFLQDLKTDRLQEKLTDLIQRYGIDRAEEPGTRNGENHAGE